jgi:5-methyltetrahydrofolate--homocysteine methyltransferase
VRTIDDQPLTDLRPYIDWSPFFQTWELKGKFPRIFEDSQVGVEARKLFDDANKLLDRIIAQKLLVARGVYGFWPANSRGDDIIISDFGFSILDFGLKDRSVADQIQNPKSKIQNSIRFPMLRQQWERQGQSDFRSLADYIAPADSSRSDYLGAFAVTAGHGCDELAKKFDAEHDEYNSIMTKALADRLAEAFAEYLHERVRREWGYGAKESLSKDDLIEEKYRGIRPAFGYPACPDHTRKRTLFDLLEAEARTGITLTDSYAMWPAASVSGLYFAHPQARYFAVDRITRDQVDSYAQRTGMTVAEVERWLGPNLGYDA